MDGESVLVSSPFLQRLQGKVAMITGASRGVGECMARLFAKHGAKVIIVDVLDDLGQTVCEDIGLDKATFIHCDVTIESDVENAVNLTVSKYGKLDIMVNNAAIIDDSKQSILDNDKVDFERVVSVNLTGVFLGTKHAARVMIPAGGGGSIISVGSVASSVGGVASHAYTSSKHAVVGLTRNVAAELGKFQIRVNCLSPYFISTPLTDEFFKMDEKTASGIYSNLQGTLLRLQDVADAALFLASDDSRYVSGHNLSLDGGFTVINPAFGIFARN